MKKLGFVILFVLSKANADMATDLLKASDLARGSALSGLQWDAEVLTQDSEESSQRTFFIRANSQDSLVEAKAPTKYKNEVYLINKNSMWFYKPSLKKPISISSRQKLSGQASSGDIASINYFRDYTAVIEKSEMIEGEKMHVLLLKAKSANLTYDRIRYWISDKTKLAKQAEFLDLQGRPFKKAKMKYDNILVLKNKKIPFVSELEIVDAKFQDKKSIIKYSNVKMDHFSDAIFNVNNLTR